MLKGDAVAKAEAQGQDPADPRRPGRGCGSSRAVFKKSAPREDPWATPLDDPYTAPTTGRDSTAAARDKVATLADAAKEKASQRRRGRQGQGDRRQGQGSRCGASDAKDKVSSKSDEAGEKAADTVDDFSVNPDDTQGTTGTPGNIG